MLHEKLKKSDTKETPLGRDFSGTSEKSLCGLLRNFSKLPYGLFGTSEKFLETSENFSDLQKIVLFDS